MFGDIASRGINRIRATHRRGNGSGVTLVEDDKVNAHPNAHPYIGLRARLSQIWLNEYTIAALLILIKLILFRLSINSGLSGIEQFVTGNCDTTSSILSSAASVPHYAASGVNKLVSMGANQTVEGVIDSLLLVITGVENLLIFSLELWIGTYACLLTAAVDGTVGSAINATESVISFVNSSLGTITSDLQDGLDGLATVINGIEEGIEDVADFFTGDNSDDGGTELNRVNLTISKLRDFTIPSSVNEKLEEVESNLPTYDNVKESVEQFLREPFDTLKKELNSTLQDSGMGLDPNTLHVPAKASINTCDYNDDISDLFSTLAKGVGTITTICIVLIVIAAILACIPVAYHEYKQWNWMKEVSSDSSSSMEAIHDANNYAVVKVQNLASRAMSHDRKAMLSKWWVDYVLYPRSRMVGLLALAGILVVVMQLAIISKVRAAIPEIQQGVGNTTLSAVSEIDSGTSKWAASVNDAMNSTEGDVNGNMFSWVLTATESVNKTLNEFSSSMNKTLHDDFEGTILYDPISTVVYCVIGSKIEQVKKGLTWVHDHAHISLPRVNSSMLATGDNSDGQKLANSTSNSVGRAMTLLVNQYQKSVLLELYISLVLLAIWTLIALGGLLYCIYKYRQFSNKPFNPFMGHPDSGKDGLNSLSYPKRLVWSIPKPPALTSILPWPTNRTAPPKATSTPHYHERDLGTPQSTFDVSPDHKEEEDLWTSGIQDSRCVPIVVTEPPRYSSRADIF